MNIETSPIVLNVGTQWKKVENSTPTSPAKQPLSFLYIGSHFDSNQSFATHFESGIFAEDYSKAQLLLEKSRQEALPDVIFINIPLVHVYLTLFCSFLKQKGIYTRLSIIYNESKLDAGKVRFLRQNQLVDDVLNINSDQIDFASRVQFLNRMKDRTKGLVISQTGQIQEVLPINGHSVVKRSLDVLLSSAAIIACLPVFASIAVAIKLTSPGPIFYTSKRAGRGYRVFNFFKFRTMEVDADKKIAQLAHLNQYGSEGGTAQFVKIDNDPRVTRLGKLLRKTSLDEIPQLFNVLKGDMSLVGNRPLPLYEATTLTTNDSVERFMAPAGITGLWQIKKRGKQDMSVTERINLDIDYARKANTAYDLWIMVKTPSALFQKSNG